MTRDLSSRTGSARMTIVLDEGSDFRPGVVSSNELKSYVLAIMSGKYMVALAT